MRSNSSGFCVSVTSCILFLYNLEVIYYSIGSCFLGIHFHDLDHTCINVSLNDDNQPGFLRYDIGSGACLHSTVSSSTNYLTEIKN